MTKNHKEPDSSGIRNVAILFAVIAALYLARDLLIPLAFALTLAMILSPLVGLLQKLRLGRVPAAIVVVVVATACVASVSWVIFNELVAVASELPGYQQNINKKIEALQAPGSSALSRAADSVKALSKEISALPAVPPPDTPRLSRPQPVQVVEPPSNEFQYLRELVKPFLRPLAVFGMVLIFCLYLLIEEHDLRNRLFRLVGIDQLNMMTQALDDATQRVGRYLMLQLLVNICFGTLCGSGLYLIGVPYAALWGVVAAISRLVPYVGWLVAASLPLLLSLAVFDGWKHPLMVFAVFAVLELVTGNLIEPWLYGMHTGVSSLALLLTAVFWAALWGPAGLVLSTPLTVCVVVLGRYAPQFSFLHVMLGDEAALELEAQLYQRLLAMDEQGARAVADGYLKDHTITELYDSVLIPGLTMAEQDRHKGELEPAREEFLFLSVKEMLSELIESNSKPDIPQGQTGRVICVPAQDEADEISAAMLGQLLELNGRAAFPFPVDPDLLQLVKMLEPTAEDVICISALPPFAFSQAKALSRQMRTRFPQTKLVVGVWGFTGDPEAALARFQSPRPDHFVTTLAQALEAITEPSPASAELPVTRG